MANQRKGPRLKMGATVSATFGRVEPPGPAWAPHAMSLGRGPHPYLWHVSATVVHPDYWIIPLYPVDGAWPEQVVLLWDDGRSRVSFHKPHNYARRPWNPRGTCCTSGGRR